MITTSSHHKIPTVSIQGEQGSFHHIAAGRLFENFTLLERPSFEEVFTDVSSGEADYAVVAVENSIAGSIAMNYSRLARFKVPIIAETYLRISHHFIVNKGVQPSEITEIWSHPMAIEQCRAFLASQGGVIIEKEDTAGSVKLLKQNALLNVAAIASELAAEIYDMTILNHAIETDPQNYTRFLILSYEMLGERYIPESWKTTLHFGVRHTSGALHKVLALLSEQRVNMTKLESRPQIGQPWQYDFIVDLELNFHSPQGKSVVDLLREECTFVEVLGCYGTV